MMATAMTTGNLNDPKLVKMAPKSVIYKELDILAKTIRTSLYWASPEMVDKTKELSTYLPLSGKS